MSLLTIISQQFEDAKPVIELTHDDLRYMKHREGRRLSLDGTIESINTYDIMSEILLFNEEDAGVPVEERKPIKLYISSNGGNVDDGYQLIDVIENSVTPVYTINTGCAYSMAFLIAISGHKRFATKHSTFLMHDGTNFVIDSGAKAQDRMDFVKRVDKMTRDFVLSHGSISEEEYDEKLRIEWYMFADEAKELGFVDCIIGEDCDAYEVI